MVSSCNERVWPWDVFAGFYLVFGLCENGKWNCCLKGKWDEVVISRIGFK